MNENPNLVSGKCYRVIKTHLYFVKNTKSYFREEGQEFVLGDVFIFLKENKTRTSFRYLKLFFKGEIVYFPFSTFYKNSWFEECDEKY